MPSSAEILRQITALANDAIAVAMVWHVVLAGVVVALALGRRPSPRAARIALVVPLASVAIAAAWSGNPFTAIGIGLGAIALGVLGATSHATGAASGRRVGLIVGACAVAIGWVYPHFLTGHPALYLFAAPVGLAPCPTLLVVIGLALVTGVFSARAWGLVLAGIGLFYGVVGVVRLGVMLDLALIVAAAALAIASVLAAARSARVVGGGARLARVA